MSTVICYCIKQNESNLNEKVWVYWNIYVLKKFDQEKNPENLVVKRAFLV